MGDLEGEGKAFDGGKRGGRDFQGLGMSRWALDLASSGKPPLPTAAAPWRGDAISDDWVTSQPQQRFPCPNESGQEANLWSPRVHCSCGHCKCQRWLWLSENWWPCTVSRHPGSWVLESELGMRSGMKERGSFLPSWKDKNLKSDLKE